MQETISGTSEHDFQVGVNRNAGELPERLDSVMRDNSDAAAEMLRQMRAGITPKRVWYSRLPRSVQS